MDRPLIGTTLGRYRLEVLLGEGGMAQVYRATDPAIGRAVAVKVIHPRLARDLAFVARFLREARVVARLQHPHIVPLYGFEEENGLPYIVMPYLGGGTFADLLREGLTPAETLTFLGPIAAALDYAHVRGVVHRDVKPGNILFTDDGEPLLADFGIARVAGDAAITEAGTQVGTLLYLAPEQAQGQPFDGRADLYALAVIFYEALAGRPPFPMGEGDTPLSVAMRVASAPIPSPRTFNPGLPAGVDGVLLRALAKSPDERYPDGGALCAALSAALAGAPASPLAPHRPSAATTQFNVRPSSVPASARRNGSPRLFAVAGILLTLLLVCVVAGVGVRLLASPDTRADQEVLTATAPPPILAAVETSTAIPVVLPTVTTAPTPTLAPTQTATATPTVLPTLAATLPPPTEMPAQPTPTPTPVPPTAVPPTPTAIPTRAPTAVPPTATAPPPTATVVPTAVAGGTLEATAQRAILSLPGTSSGVFARLDAPDYAADDPDMVLPAGSLIKLPIAGAAYEQVALGHWKLTDAFTLTEANRTGGTGIIRDRPLGTAFTLEQLIETMLLYSDNTAANMLIERFGGFAPVNAYAARLGMGQTALRRKLFDQAAQARGVENTTTTGDVALFLVKLGAGEVVNASVSERLLGHLIQRAQRDRNWMLRDLPGGVNAAHLTGTLTGYRADAGIIESGGKLYILVLFARHSDEAGIERAIARVSAEIYQAVTGR